MEKLKKRLIYLKILIFSLQAILKVKFSIYPYWMPTFIRHFAVFSHVIFSLCILCTAFIQFPTLWTYCSRIWRIATSSSVVKNGKFSHQWGKNFCKRIFTSMAGCLKFPNYQTIHCHANVYLWSKSEKIQKKTISIKHTVHF